MSHIKPVFGKYYVVEVAYSYANPIHRAVMYSYRERKDGASADLVAAGYDCPISQELGRLAFFRIIDEIALMNNHFPNQYELPETAQIGKGSLFKV